MNNSNFSVTSLCLSMLLIFSGCKFGDTKGVKEPFDKLVQHLEERVSHKRTLHVELHLTSAKVFQKKSEKTIRDINSIKSFTRKYYVFESQQNTTDRLQDMHNRVSSGLKVCEARSRELQKIIHQTGRRNYEAFSTGALSVLSDDFIAGEIVTLFSLQYLKKVYETCSGLVFHYMNEFSVEKYDQYPEVFSIREDLIKQFFGLTGMLKVISKDSKSISEGLAQLNRNSKLSVTYEDLINELVTGLKKANHKLDDFTNELLRHEIKDELLTSYEQIQKQTDEAFKDKSLLFDPAQPDHPVIHVATVLSNLTWGAIQSGVGLGLIITHAIVITPASWILDRLFPQYFMPLRGPSLEFSENKMQIYADICGFPALPSKISLGIWELDFCTNKSFAAAHEGGHAKQSALLGPFYLPAAILSYAMNRGHGGFIETWADEWYVRP